MKKSYIAALALWTALQMGCKTAPTVDRTSLETTRLEKRLEGTYKRNPALRLIRLYRQKGQLAKARDLCLEGMVYFCLEENLNIDLGEGNKKQYQSMDKKQKNVLEKFYSELGKIYDASDNDSLAARSFRHAAFLNPQNPENFRDYGGCYVNHFYNRTGGKKTITQVTQMGKIAMKAIANLTIANHLEKDIKCQLRIEVLYNELQRHVQECETDKEKYSLIGLEPYQQQVIGIFENDPFHSFESKNFENRRFIRTIGKQQSEQQSRPASRYS